MRACRFALAALFSVALLFGCMGAAGLALAQSDEDIDKLNRRVVALFNAGNLADALPLAEQSIELTKSRHGEDHPRYAIALGNMAELLRESNRLVVAEPLYRRALAIDEKNYGPEHPKVAIRLNNLATLLSDTDRAAEAEPLMRRALAIVEKSFGPLHPDVAIRLNNLGQLLRATNRPIEAEPLMRRAIAIDERSFGPAHPNVAVGLSNLATLLSDTDRLAEAEPLLRRAIAIDERSFGPEHPNVASALNNLAALRAELGDWAEAAQLHRRAKPIMTGAHHKESDDLFKATLTRNTWTLRSAARAVHRAGGNSREAREESFELAQWALQTGAADALAQMSVRFSKGTGPLAGLVRERQDLVTRRHEEDKLLLAAVGKADAKSTEAIRTSIAGLESKLDLIDKRLATDFSKYASLANPKPLTNAIVQRLLMGDEALVVFLDVPRFRKLPEETLAWAVTKTEALWISVPLGTQALADKVATLRCGLDRGGLWSWSPLRQRWLAKSQRCRALKPDGLDANDPLPFDLAVARELHDELLKPFADLTKGKSLIIVASGPLTSLPFHVLVTDAPSAAVANPPTPNPSPQGVGQSAQRKLETLADYRKAAWLALKQPVTVLPSVGSLQALRELPPSQAKEPYVAFGNPLLDGGAPEGEEAKLAHSKQTCPRDGARARHRVATAAKDPAWLDTIFRGGGIDLTALRAQTPLPETAEELCAVARALGVLEREKDTVWLGARATETNLKALSREGKLARYSVLHFATHGLLAGESEAFLKAKAEPALLLNPPKPGAGAVDLEHDDGLLTASEVAELNLDADWVVLSACNTAAGEKGDAEALSGLARAFFYAKARALLVSHWYVISDAAVKLTTRAFVELKASPTIGRAEALRRSMAKMITNGRPEEAHPEHWGPVRAGG